MKLQRGDVVLLDFPYSDGSGGKVRPAVVIQSDEWNTRLDDTIVAMVTSGQLRQVNSPTQLFVAANSDDAQQAGFRMDSVIQCENLATRDQSLALRLLGQLPETTMKRLDECLKISLGLN